MTTAPKPYPRHIRATQEQIAGRWVKRCVVTCSACRTDVEMIRIPVDMLARVLANHGWVSGDDPKRATCPLCVASHNAARVPALFDAPKPIAAPRPPVTAVTAPIKKPQQESPMPKADVPRTPMREDNRRIQDELTAVYDVDGGCYQKNFSDASVAQRLNVPRAWVSAIREQFFGPDISAAKKEAPRVLEAFEARAKALEERGLALATDAEALRKEVAAYRVGLALTDGVA